MNKNATRRAISRRRKAAFILPSLFTAGNLFLGFLAIQKTIHGAMLAEAGHLGANEHLITAAKCIGIAVLLDGLDGRIARLMNTVSQFGKEIDSLADVITFGVAPAILAFFWGVHFADGSNTPLFHEHLLKLGYFACFLYLLCGAARLARFNIQENPIPKIPGRPDRKYFVGLPIPAAAGLIAAIVYATDARPLTGWISATLWILLLTLLSFLMVSTWRYVSFKDVSLLKPRSRLTLIGLGCLIYAVWNYPQPVLLLMAVSYVSSGIITRLTSLVRHKWHEPVELGEHQASESL